MPALLSAKEPGPLQLLNAAGSSDVVLVCDHASNRIPAQLHSLGLTTQAQESHIAWDPGAYRVARYLSACLDAPLVASNYSRLVIDCNRLPGTADSIPASSAGIAVPGNQALSAQQSLDRRQALFDPYHAAIDRLLEARAGRPSLLLSIHSFTAFLQGIERPWPIGVCYGDEESLAARWLAALQAQLSVPVGDNEPYSIEEDVDYTCPVHGRKHDIPALMLEIRQDQVGSQSAAKHWSGIIANAWQHCR